MGGREKEPWVGICLAILKCKWQHVPTSCCANKEPSRKVSSVSEGSR